VVVADKVVCQEILALQGMVEHLLLNTRVDNLQYGHFGQCSTKCMSVADTVTGHSCDSCKIFTSLAAALVAAVFATVHAAAICVVGTILGVFTGACYPNSLSKHSWQ